MQSLINQFKSLNNLTKITMSDTKSIEYKKIIIRPIIIKQKKLWQIERHTENKVFHSNVDDATLFEFCAEIYPHYRQIAFYYAGETISYNKSGASYHQKITTNTLTPADLSHNKTKNYILSEGANIPALVDLGVFSPNFTINKAKFDKFKQINRFVEIVGDAVSDFNQDHITILDFGCGKSYLTFILYYYFVEIKKINATIIGYDLKADVVNQCNEIAKKYGYENLHFYINDVAKGDFYQGDIDMIITLHACDTATDYALDYAISQNVKYIFSVPCCQHEINQSIKPGGDYDILLKHGLIKERFCALLTDSIRAEILHQSGYSVDLLEFVDFSHSPKNIMIRAKRLALPKIRILTLINFVNVTNSRKN